MTFSLLAVFRWDLLNTQIASVTALAAAACAVPGTLLFVRRQSLLGDAISHTALLGMIGGFLFASQMVAFGVISPDTRHDWEGLFFSAGAMLVGVATAILSEWVSARAKVDSTAALGIAYATAFALGLLLLENYARNAHIDPEHILFGQVELAADHTYGRSDVPRAAVTSGVLFLLNAAVVGLVLKELRLVSFDPGFATTLGYKPRLIGWALAAVVSATLITVFEAVGLILPIAMLITPAAAARCWTDRLGRLLVLSVVIGTTTGVLGHLAAVGVPALIEAATGAEKIPQTGTAGTTALLGGLVFLASLYLGPRGRQSVW
ncbi:MAG: metal ABC transporter permease, partial [Planctomycetota bacterium]